MKFKRFRHEVRAQVELSGLDLVVLECHAKQHYDGACRRFFEGAREVRGAENDGYVWLGKWQWEDWTRRFGDDPEAQYTSETTRHPSEDLEFAVVVEASSRTLNLCMKILERLAAEDTWALVEELTGRKMPPIEKKMSELVVPLRASLKEAFNRIQEETRRLDEEQSPAPEFDGELKCSSCGSEEVEWQEYVLHTRRVLGVRGDQVCVDLGSEEAVYEATKDEALSCKACFGEFKVPGGLSIDHVERVEFEEEGAG